MSAQTDLTLEIVEETPIELNLVDETPVTIELKETGAKGADGADGQDGEDGQGVPTGGTTNQVLAKASDEDFDTEWKDVEVADIPYYQYIYNSSGEQSGNRFNDWADLIAAIDGREARIVFEQDETLPVGSWFQSHITWVGNGNNPGNGAPEITIPDGCSFSHYINWMTESGLTITSESNSPVIEQEISTSHGFDRVKIQSFNAPFFRVTGTNLHAFFVANGGGLYNAGQPVIQYDGSAYAAYVVSTEQGIQGDIEDDTIASSVPMVFLQLKQSSESAKTFATHSGVDGASVIQQRYFSNAAVVGFLEGQPSGITSNTVSDALAELAARITTLEGYH